VSETVLGIPASLGVGVGPSFVVPRPGRALRRHVSGREAEVERLRTAIEEGRAEIERARDSLEGKSEISLVLDAQLLLHSDAMLADAAYQLIRDSGVGAEWAVEQTVDALSAPLRASSARYFRERADDIAHVGRHLLRHLRGDGELTLPTTRKVVLFAADLSPAEAARVFAESGLLGVVLETGSATSHTALLARALEVPAVVGARGVLDRVLSGDVVVVDGIRGRVILEPDDAERQIADDRAGRYRAFARGLLERRAEPVATRDGVEITVRANLELPEEAELARTHGARGVGLYRTEFLLLHRGAAPDEEAQLATYREVIEEMAPAPVVFRIFDLGGDKLPPDQRFARGPNPAMGLRAMRLLRRRPELLRTQVRALLRATTAGDLRIMFPMIGGLADLREAKAFVERCAEELSAERIEHELPPLGCMVEVPAAALRVSRLAAECDFLSVGTNDLVQYTLAADRTDPEVAEVASPLDPAVLMLLGQIADGAEGSALSMCGDMASDPLALPLVLGLGYRSLSVAVGSLPLVLEMIRQLDLGELASLAAEACEADDAAAVATLVRERCGEPLGQLWREVDA